MTFSQSISYPKQINDSVVEITAEQLKKTNLIFVEHKSLKSENKELHFQIEKYKDLINNYNQQDSINSIKIRELTDYSKFANDQLTIKDKEIYKLNKLKNNYKIFTICGITISTVLGVLLICK
ncbi:hypothetical protein [Lachnospira sp.]|uniref:hypothetical protein n=1 Tax=Lachnospira sp. TaxID=2049031 RepID=UPI00257F1998|nr:hypothetical protein [Lachnospira sp.]